MSYNPDTKIYYNPASDPDSTDNANRLVPGPRLSIEQEYIYANDIVIGYNYLINIDGYCTSLDMRDPPQFIGVPAAIKTVKNIFNKNGGVLLVKNGDKTVLKAKGGTIQSINFQESANNWVNYAEYSIQISFNELELSECDASILISCGDIPTGIDYVASSNLLDMQQYKVKSFNDSWSINADENIYNAYDHSNDAKFRNEHFSITYTINCTGKHYFDDSNLIPAWEQAKNFCQYRLYNEVSKLINDIVQRTSLNQCAPTKTFDDVFGTSGIGGLLSGLSESDYDVFNEIIDCKTSEADGSFTATYNALVKRTNTTTYSDPRSLHTFRIGKTIQNDGPQKNIVFSIDGNIQGLIKGGLINSPNILEFPNNGSIFLSNEPTSSKYNNALLAYNKIISDGILKGPFIDLLGINMEALEVDCPGTSYPPPINHSATHNYGEGTISYKAEYNSNKACAGNSLYNNITINIDEPIPVVAEFIIPGRGDKGPIIQKFPAKTSRKISVSIEGRTDPECCHDPGAVFQQLCQNGIALPTGIPASGITNLIIVEDTHNFNAMDGSFTINRGYVCCDSYS